MKIDLVRTLFTNKSTIGDFIINDSWYAFSLEDKDRQWQADGSILPWKPSLKIPKETAIPYGQYEVIINFSNKFQRDMPLLLNVPDYIGIRIHNGSYADHTDGCPLIGFNREADMIYNSKSAFNSFMPILRAALKKEKVWIRISNWYSYRKDW